MNVDAMYRPRGEFHNFARAGALAPSMHEVSTWLASRSCKEGTPVTMTVSATRAAAAFYEVIGQNDRAAGWKSS
jgi:hypothetical protein